MQRLMKTLLVFTAVQMVAMSGENLFAVGGDMGNCSGTQDDPYLIEDFADFSSFASDSNYWASGVHTQLTTDIDLDPSLPGRQVYTTAVIAPNIDSRPGYLDGIAFAGIFDGNDHKIMNLTINGGGNEFLGLLGWINDGEVRNLGLEVFNFVWRYYRKFDSEK